MVAQSSTVWIVRCVLALGLGAVCCVGCKAKKVLPQDAIEGRATLIAVGGGSCKVSVVLINISSKEAVMVVGPTEGRSPDGTEVCLGSPGVSMAVFEDDEWVAVDDSVTLGEDWKGRIRIQPGKQYSCTIKFGVSKRSQASLKSGAPVAVILYGIDEPPATFSKDLVLPLSLF